MHLTDAITKRIGQAQLLHWQLGRRVHINVKRGEATLVMGWRTADGQVMLPVGVDDLTVAGGNVISVDPKKIPKGVTATTFSALPDTVETIDVPTAAELLAAAKLIGAKAYERQDHPSGDWSIVMIGVGTAADRCRLEQVGQALYGDRWQSNLARALSVNDRRVRQWLSAERPIPSGLWTDISVLLRAKRATCDALLVELETHLQPISPPEK